MKRVTAIGEILWDVYPEQKRLGGAPFNFIYHIWKILGKASFISSVGNDGNGYEIINHLNAIGFDTSNILIDRKYPTGTVQVTLDEEKKPKFKISSECSFDHLSVNEQINEVFEKETDLLYFGTFTTRHAASRDTVLSLLNNCDKKYFCDLNLRHDFYTKEFVERTLQVCNVIKMNEAELEKLKFYFELAGENAKAIEQLMDKFNIELIGLTLGEKGAELYTGSLVHKSASSLHHVVDTLGAGDAYSAILCLGYLYGWEINKINSLAGRFAGEICTLNGALPQDDSFYFQYQELFLRG